MPATASGPRRGTPEEPAGGGHLARGHGFESAGIVEDLRRFSLANFAAHCCRWQAEDFGSGPFCGRIMHGRARGAPPCNEGGHALHDGEGHQVGVGKLDSPVT